MTNDNIEFYSKLHNELIDAIGIEPDKYEREDAFFGIISDIDNGKDEEEVFIKTFNLVYDAELDSEVYKLCYYYTKETKKNNTYEYEINIDESYANTETDEWGAAFLWLNDDHGVEYNFAIDSGTNCSAIYKLDISGEYAETDTSTFSHYEIDFNNKDWKLELVKEMTKVAKQFWKEDFKK